jgi:hypothetical protein
VTRRCPITQMIEAPGTEALRSLGRWSEDLAQPGFRIGQWVTSTTDDQGRIHLGWFELGEDGRRFLAEVSSGGWVQPFDWMAWLQTPEGRRLREAPAGVQDATAEDLSRLLTAIARSERFSEGSIAGAFESGLLLAITRRARDLAEGG